MTMLMALAIVVVAGIGGLAASYLLWWSSHRSGLWNLIAGAFLALILLVVAVLIGYVMVWSTGPF